MEYGDIQEYVVRLRRELHSCPEVGANLPKTRAIVTRELDAMGIPYRCAICDSGVTAVVAGERPGRVLAIRADMDALQIKEETGLPFASVNGNMHACGHDAHTAMLLGAAKLLSGMSGRLNGSVRLLFQTDEEQADGALRMIKGGALDDPKPDAVVGIHIGLLRKGLPNGHFSIVKGPVMASNDGFAVTVTGRGCHGATPEAGVDPIAVSAEIISALQTVISREVKPTVPSVLSVCKISGGISYNIIPDSAAFEGTVRTMSNETRAVILERIEKISCGIASAMRAEAKFERLCGTPPVVNDGEMAELCAEAVSEAVGSDRVRTSEDEPIMIAEDFAYYLEKVPGVLMFLSSENGAKHADAPHHSSKFDIDEDVLWEGSAAFASIALKFLK